MKWFPHIQSKSKQNNKKNEPKSKRNVVIKISGSLKRLRELNTVDIYQIKHGK